MIPLRARAIAARHRDLLGAPQRSWRISSGPLLPLLYLAILFMIALMLLVNPHGSLGGDVAIVVVIAVILVAVHLVVIDPRLVVCERGLILGRLTPLVPFSPTYVIGGREIDPRTVCVVSSGSKAAAELGLPSFFFQFFAYPGALGVPAVMFKGPWGADSTMSRPRRPLGPVEKSLYSFSHRRADRIADQILHMIGRCGAIPHGFRPANDLRPIALSGRREDAVHQIPGAWPPDSPQRA